MSDDFNKLMAAFEPSAVKMVKDLMGADMAADPKLVTYSQGTHRGIIHALADGLAFAKALNDSTLQRVTTLEKRLAALEPDTADDEAARAAIEAA